MARGQRRAGSTHIGPGSRRLGMALTPLAFLLVALGVLGLLAGQAIAGIAVVLMAAGPLPDQAQARALSRPAHRENAGAPAPVACAVPLTPGPASYTLCG